jgi:hypothetical protein
MFPFPSPWRALTSYHLLIFQSTRFLRHLRFPPLAARTLPILSNRFASQSIRYFLSLLPSLTAQRYNNTMPCYNSVKVSIIAFFGSFHSKPDQRHFLVLLCKIGAARSLFPPVKTHVWYRVHDPYYYSHPPMCITV